MNLSLASYSRDCPDTVKDKSGQRLNTCFKNEEMGILAGEVKNIDTQRGKGWGVEGGD